MPSTSTSRPPLTVLVTRASTITPLPRVSQSASMAAPFRLSTWMPSSGSKRLTTTSIVEPGCGKVALELVDRKNALALAPEIDEDALAADADDLAGAQARAALLAPLVSWRRVLRGPVRGGAIFADGCRIKAGEGGLELGFHSLIPLALERQVEMLRVAASSAGDRRSAGVDRGVHTQIDFSARIGVRRARVV